MADPLSIAASITGLLGVAGQIVIIIKGFISSVADAPESARSALTAVEEMSMVLTSVRQVMDHYKLSQLPRHRKAMIHVRHLVVIFRESILSFSHLEALLKPAIPGIVGKGTAWDRFRWVAEETKILEAVARLEGHKSSISLVLTILQCESDIEAKDRFNTLEEKIDMLVAHALSQPLKPGSIQYDFYHGSEEASMRSVGDDQSTIRPDVEDNNTIHQPPSTVSARNSFIPDAIPLLGGMITPREFEIILESTRVYKRVQSNESDMSFTSSEVGTQGWSMLSGLSLNDISVISVIALPISIDEITSIGDALSFASILSDAQVGGHSNSRNSINKDSHILAEDSSEDREPFDIITVDMLLRNSWDYQDLYNFLDNSHKTDYWLGYITDLDSDGSPYMELAGLLALLTQHRFDKRKAMQEHAPIERFWTPDRMQALWPAMEQFRNLCTKLKESSSIATSQQRRLIGLMKNFEILLKNSRPSEPFVAFEHDHVEILAVIGEIQSVLEEYDALVSKASQALKNARSRSNTLQRSLSLTSPETRKASSLQSVKDTKPSESEDTRNPRSLLRIASLGRIRSRFPLANTSPKPAVSTSTPSRTPTGSTVHVPRNRLTLYKLVVLGDGGSGKTELTVRFTLNYFVDSYDPTIEDSYRKQIVVDNEKCMVEVMDTAGQEEYTALRDQWIKEGEGFLVVYSITSRSTFSQVPKYFKQVEKMSAKDWSRNSKRFGAQNPRPPPPPIMLVGNHTDRFQDREVSTQEGVDLARELGCSFIEVSTEFAINVDKAFMDVVRLIRRQRNSST